MVTSVYQGGLGNLLFQISSGYIFSKNNKEIDVVIPEIAMPSWVNGWTRFPSRGN